MPKSAHSSPDKPNLQKTYLQRRKPKKQLKEDPDPSSESDPEIPPPPPKTPNVKATGSKGSMKPPNSVAGSASKKHNFVEPDLPKRHARTESVASATKTPKGKPSHNRGASSLSTIGPLVVGSPARDQKPVSNKREGSPETDLVDDSASVAESFVSLSKVRRSEAERIEYFKNQDDVDKSNIDPHQVTCTRCNKNVNLGNKQTYAVKPWEKHREKCDQRISASMLAGNDAVSEAESTATSRPIAKRRTETQRKQILETDDRAEEVKPYEILCKRCQKWIQLNKKQTYGLQKWFAHQESCSESAPSSYVASVERKLRVINDPQADSTDWGPRHVKCHVCQTRVELVGEEEYTLTAWDTHKAGCNAPKAKSSQSSASSKTLVAPSPMKKGVKRAREEEDGDADAGMLQDAAEEPPSNKPRTENYEPPQQDAPGPFGWFLMPFKAFVQGFMESMRSEAHA